MRTVLVLGAGFSYAIDNKMPLTDDLGNLVRHRLPPVSARMPRNFTGGYFEAWLSRLAESQPDLTAAQNATNQGLFLEVAAELARLLQERELEVLQDKPKWWLQRLIGLLHATRTTAITFNYDTLVERTAPYLRLGGWKDGSFAKPFNVVRNIPPGPPRGGWIVDRGADTFRLLKLHGSLDSYWVPGDQSGSTIGREDVSGSWEDAKPVDEAKRRERFPGREPYIVPPAAAKSAFYTNPIARELWRTAAEELGAAERIALVGYSLPPTDLVTSGMLADALSTGLKYVDVVNPYPDTVVDRLKALGQPDSNIRCTGGHDAAEQYTNQLEHEHGQHLATMLEKADDSSNLLVGTSIHRVARVTGIRTRPDGVELEVDQIGSVSRATEKDPHRTQPVVSVPELRAVLRHGSTAVVRYPDGAVATVVTTSTYHTDVGLGNGHWIVLVPPAMPAGASR